MAGVLDRSFGLRSLLPGDFYCAGCAERVCAGIQELDGVSSVECDLADGMVRVVFDAERLTERDLASALERIALEETGRVGHAAFRVTGLD